jgi:hypothetical protein
MLSFKYILSLLFFISVLQCKGQIAISDINFNKVPQKKVREYLIEQQENTKKSLTDIEPSIKPDSKLEGFRIHEKEYFLKDSIAKVWRHYLVTNPGDSWNGKKVSFGMLFSKKDKKIIYCNESISHIETGQVVYVNLKLLQGLANLVTAFEFITIDNEKRMLEFSYIDGNITEGKQCLQFIKAPKGYTRIIHTTYYKSSSFLRDKLYPYFHVRIINEFHRNMKKLYLSQKARELNIPQDFTNPDRIFSEKVKYQKIASVPK